MEALLSRFRNLTVLLIVVVGQLLYLAYQVKTNRDERLIRVWAISAVTPMAGVVEGVRRNTVGFAKDYFVLLDVREQNRKLKADNDRLRMENVHFRNELSTAEHARALVQFQAQSPSKTVAARVIGNSTVASAKAVFIDRGSTSGIEKGMAVVTPEGIVGKVMAVYPLTAQVLLVTDPTFKVGVESQRGHVHGILACTGSRCVVEQIQNEEKVDPGEWFYTSGEDRLFPKGFPVGNVISAQSGQGMKDVELNLSGAPGGVEEVLVVLQGVHQPIPTAAPMSDEPVAKMLPPPPQAGEKATAHVKPQTEADKVIEKYGDIGKAEGHVYGGIASNMPNFNVKPGSTPAPESTPQNSAGTATAAGATTAAGSAARAPAPAAQAAQKPDTNAAPAPAEDNPPDVLGTRAAPKTAPQNTAAPAAHPNANPNTSTGPVLPLGAPRHKAAAPPPQPPPQQ